MDRLSPLDASFLHVEDDVNYMHIGAIGIFAGPPPGIDEFRRSLAGRLHRVPRYRQRIRTVPLGLGRPVWVDDPNFRIDHHVRHTALPRPGGDVELERLVGRVMSQRLDRAKPLWEMWVVEGLEDDRWALVAKVHHCLVDGVSGAELLAVTLDLGPEPPAPVEDAWRPGPLPSPARLARDAAVDLATSPYEQARAAGAVLRRPGRVIDAARELARGSVALSGLVHPTPPTSLNGPIGPHRRYTWTALPLADAKAVRRRHGGTLNDVVLALITRGFRDLLLARGEDVHGRVLRSLVPVSVRPRDEGGTAVGDGTLQNRVSAMFAELPVGIDDPVARLGAVGAQLADLKRSKQAVAAEALTSLGGFAPAMLLSLGMRGATRAARRSGHLDTVTTNVPGPQFPLWSCGRRLVRALPYVPLAAPLRVGVAIFSYDGELTFGVTADADTAGDVDVLARGIRAELDDLLAHAPAPAPAAGSGAEAGVSPPAAVPTIDAVSTPKLYHNPRCGKSRAAKDLLEERGVEVEVVQYLKTPPSRADLEAIVAGLDGDPQELVRTKDPKFKALGVDPAGLTDATAVVDLLVEHPEVMERPVLVVDGRAAIGRPLERIEALLG